MLVGKIASNNISDETVADKMSGKMIEIIPAKMLEMGLAANAEKVYGKGSFFVVKLYVYVWSLH